MGRANQEILETEVDDMTDKKNENQPEGEKKRPSLEEIRKSKNTFGGGGSFGGGKIGGANSRGKGGNQSRPGGAARGR